MSKVVDNGLKVDFHIHSYYSITKDSASILNHSTINDVPLLIQKLNDNGIQMCAITDHDTFNYDLYSELKMYESDTNSSLIKVLPGVEFSVTFNRNNVKKQLHVIALFQDDDSSKLKHIESVLALSNHKPTYDCQDSFSERKFIQILSDINLDTVLIVHQKQTLTSKSKPKNNDANSLGKLAFNEFVTSEYFEAYEFKNRKNELFNNLSVQEYEDDLLRFITGSDCHDWSVYPKHDQSSTDDDIKFTYFKCLPTFKGIAFALTDITRISLENNFFTSDKNNYVKDISLRIKEDEINIPLSKGINAIIGDNSIGKSLLLHKLTNYYRKDENSSTSSIDASIIKGYDNYLNDNDMEIKTILNRNQIFEFDTQGEVRKKFNLKKLDGKAFYKKKFPPDVDVKNAEEICFKNLEKICDYLNQKFDYDEQIKKLNSLQFLDKNIEAQTITYVECDNFFSKKIQETTNMISQISQSIIDIKKLIAFPFEEEEITNFKKMLDYFGKLLDKYNKILFQYNEKVKIINFINTEFASINHNKEKIQTTEAQQLSTYINKKNNFETNIVETYNKKYKKYNGIENIVPIKVQVNEYPYFSYRFVKKTSVNIVDKKYLIELLCTPMKKGFSIEDFSNISKEQFIDCLLRYDEEKYPNCVEFYKLKVKQKIKNDFKSVSSIVRGKDKAEISYSDGINSQIYFDITCNDRYSTGLYLIDQPEDDISPHAIKKYLLSDFKRMSKNRQIILITHNPQFVVNLDVDNVIVLTKDLDDGSLVVKSGALEYQSENTNIIESVANTLDGGIESIRKRWKRYDKENINK